MSRNFRVLLVVVVVVIGGAVAAFLYATRPLEEASEDVQDNAEQLEASDADAAVFRISQEESQVEFNIFEVLMGRDNTVVGTTSEVAGDIMVNFADPSASEVGEFRINARTLKTDSSRRDGAIGRQILNSDEDEFEFITFQPTDVSGLPDSVAVGDTVDFEIMGDLSISGTTNSVTFTGQATLESDEKLVGTAEAIVTREAYGLTIPNVSSVTNVGDEVTLKISFVANKVEEA